MTRPDHVTGTWGSELIYNQSLAGAGQRWLCTDWECREDVCLVHPRTDAPGPRTLRLVVYGSGLVLVLIVLVVAGRPFRPPAPPPVEGQVSAVALECGIVLLLMLLLSPMSSKAHFGVLLLPGFCLARAALGHGWGTEGTRPLSGVRPSLAFLLLVLAVSLGLVANKDLLGGRWYTLALWYGSATAQGLLLLVGCLWVLGKGRAVQVVRASPHPAGAPAPQARAA